MLIDLTLIFMAYLFINLIPSYHLSLEIYMKQSLVFTLSTLRWDMKFVLQNILGGDESIQDSNHIFKSHNSLNLDVLQQSLLSPSPNKHDKSKNLKDHLVSCVVSSSASFLVLFFLFLVEEKSV